jgi:NAD(P)-dependent dehydrogenase (short-subunit alcohol dehydrogenase family)
MKRSVRCVLVAGATGTLGRAVTAALLQRGDRVIALARSRASLASLKRHAGHHGQLQTVCSDLSLEGGPERAVRAALRHGPIDDLVLSLGGFVRTEAAALTREALEQMVAVHAIAPMLLVRGLRESLAASRGAVVAISDEGVCRPYPNHAAYLAAKGALDAGLRALAVELAPAIRINVLRPGVVSDPERPHDARRSERLAARSAMGRFGSASEVAAVVLAMLDAGWLAARAWTVG